MSCGRCASMPLPSPSVVYGVGAHHMGGVNEHATVEDLQTVLAVHAFAAFDYLRDD